MSPAMGDMAHTDLPTGPDILAGPVESPIKMQADAPTPPPRIGSADRLALALFAAAAVHAVIILGITFSPDLFKPKQIPLTMEITLVQSHTDEAPKKADYLAQANQKGGGNVKEKMRPSSPFPHPVPTPKQGSEPQTRPARSPRPQPVTKNPVLTTDRDSSMQAQMEQKVPQRALPQALDADALVERSREMARLDAEIRRQQQVYAQQPRERYITANTKKYADAAYMEAWRMKVERIGNLNYPDEAKRRDISGNLILDVAINANGSIHSIHILKSSGHKVLDDGAKRIVRLAAPFSPLPASIRKDTDILHIVRAWQFESDYSLHTLGR